MQDRLKKSNFGLVDTRSKICGHQKYKFMKHTYIHSKAKVILQFEKGTGFIHISQDAYRYVHSQNEHFSYNLSETNGNPLRDG